MKKKYIYILQLLLDSQSDFSPPYTPPHTHTHYTSSAPVWAVQYSFTSLYLRKKHATLHVITAWVNAQTDEETHRKLNPPDTHHSFLLGLTFSVDRAHFLCTLTPTFTFPVCEMLKDISIFNQNFKRIYNKTHRNGMKCLSKFGWWFMKIVERALPGFLFIFLLSVIKKNPHAHKYRWFVM